MKPKILHITESFGGGVAIAIESYARNSPQFDHYLLAASRFLNTQDYEGGSIFAKTWQLPRNSPGAIATIRKVSRELQPNVVHLHSSIGGVWGRLAINKKMIPIVYTPHCYAFERSSTRRSIRIMVRIVEQVLSRNTSGIAACSVREEELARALNPNCVAMYIPNVASSLSNYSDARISMDPDGPSSRDFDVCTSGRITAQKDPDFFIRVADELIRSGLSVRWIGGGDEAIVERLRDRGVSVTGWLSHVGSVAEMRRCRVYLHTAAWEGFPLSVLEAFQERLGIVTRDIPAFATMPERWRGDDPQEVARLVREIVRSESVLNENIVDWGRSLHNNTPHAQSKALDDIYRGVQPSVGW